MIGWLDCAAGASGDMLLGALADAGVPLAVLQTAVDAVGLPERIVLRAEPVTRHGIGATRVHVEAPASGTTRTWRDVRALLPPGDERAHDAFARLARAEAAVHRVDPEDVHFHEVGALDAIADVVAASAGIRHLGLTALHASPVTLGSGTARGSHGRIPIPAPAVLALLAEAGAPVHGGPAGFEQCTPTGAALLAAHVSAWGPLPPMTVRTVGNGAGGRDPEELPNVLRLVIGAPVSSEDSAAVVLEANVDDLDPRLWPPVLTALLEAGASDAWLTPILMKKGRPAHTLHVLARPDRVAAVRAAVFAHTTTIGLRTVRVGKHALERHTTTVTVGGQPIGVKLATDGGHVVNTSVEYEDAAAAATALGLPVKVVLARATAAAAELLP